MSITEGAPTGAGKAYHKLHIPLQRVAQFTLLADPVTGNLLSLGAKASASSLPVVLATDQPDVAVKAATRTVLDSATVAVPANSAKTLAEVFPRAIPAGAKAVELQAQGQSVNFTRLPAAPIDGSNGYRLDDGIEKLVDTNPADVKVFAANGSRLNIVFFDKP